MWPGPRKHFRKKGMFRGRPLKPRFLTLPDVLGGDVFYIPTMGAVNPPVNTEEISVDELEALKLVYLEGLSYEEASKQMGVSRGTIWRLADSGRKKLLKAIIERRPFYIRTS
jgi:predicted DNA-binding protein (UPF0251 family)